MKAPTVIYAAPTIVVTTPVFVNSSLSVIDRAIVQHTDEIDRFLRRYTLPVAPSAAPAIPRVE